ncbi:MAG TPA: DUF4166 domain-containing protein [Alphaproteobacteria bacterium]|jgi:hypothetical protein|nr:DUF4166 domain-containing protein [Alphaproteobacteria bacterium]
MTQPLFAKVFGDDWHNLPPVMHKHYANRAYRKDETVAEGVMIVKSSVIGRILAPLFRLSGTLVPYEGEGVETSVRFLTRAADDSFTLERTFNFPNKKPYVFTSTMQPLGGAEIVEFTRIGFGWHMRYGWDGQKVTLTHCRYVLRCFGKRIRIPLEWIIGTTYAEETPVDDRTFSMKMEMHHKIFGHIFSYSGVFTLTKVTA